MFPVTGWFITEGKKGEEKEDNNDDNNKSECDINFEELFKQNDRQKIPNYSRHDPIHIPKFGHQRHLRKHFFFDDDDGNEENEENEDDEIDDE